MRHVAARPRWYSQSWLGRLHGWSTPYSTIQKGSGIFSRIRQNQIINQIFTLLYFYIYLSIYIHLFIYYLSIYYVHPPRLRVRLCFTRDTPPTRAQCSSAQVQKSSGGRRPAAQGSSSLASTKLQVQAASSSSQAAAPWHIQAPSPGSQQPGDQQLQVQKSLGGSQQHAVRSSLASTSSKSRRPAAGSQKLLGIHKLQVQAASSSRQQLQVQKSLGGSMQSEAPWHPQAPSPGSQQ